VTGAELETLGSVLDVVDGLRAKYDIDLDDEDRRIVQEARNRWCEQSYPSVAVADNIPALSRHLVYAFFQLRVSEKMDAARRLGISVAGHLSNIEAGKAFLVAARDQGRLAELETIINEYRDRA
jgi:hypothetical protein